MSEISHSDELVTKQDLSNFYQGILPYLGGMPTAIADKFDRSDIYSTSEKIIGCWTDGRPLYQKVITGTMPTCTTEGTVVQSTISIGATVNTAFIECAFARTKSTESVKFSLPIQCAVSSYANVKNNVASVPISSVYIDLSNNTVVLVNGRENYNGRTAYVVIRYTKTTDAANSFNCSSESDYSTSEKVIGTWIDGKPLYQKVITGTLSTGASSSTIKDDYYSIGASVNIGFVDKFCLLSPTGACINLNQTDYTPTGVNVNIVNNSASSNANKFHVKNNISSWGGRTFYAVIQYTKTTY